VFSVLLTLVSEVLYEFNIPCQVEYIFGSQSGLERWLQVHARGPCVWHINLHSVLPLCDWKSCISFGWKLPYESHAHIGFEMCPKDRR